MKDLVLWVRKLLGIEPNVERIVRPISGICQKLEAYSSTQVADAVSKEADAQRLLAQAGAQRKAAAEAFQAYGRIKELFAPSNS